jgi:biotin-dependent carboxylase-like uncharacterized protein
MKSEIRNPKSETEPLPSDFGFRISDLSFLRVLSPGLFTLVVDQGRPRSRNLGVAVGGPADRWSLAVGNALVGNRPGAAALEITLTGPTLQATGQLACVVFGAPFALASDRQPVVANKTFTLEAGEVLRVGGTEVGARAYLCVRGGLQTPVVLGSRSGLTPLSADAELSCLLGTIPRRSLRLAPGEPPWDYPLPASARDTVLRVLEGAHAGHFPCQKLFDTPGLMPFTVTPQSNRMGLRLAGPPLGSLPEEMLSEPVCPGTVQVTRDGQCIVLGVDAQTIGGYPRLAHVITADLDLLGQLRPGDRVGFRRVKREEAETYYRQKQAELQRLLFPVRLVEDAVE